jgi:GTP-binding protein Era
MTDDFETPEGHKSGFVAVIGRPNVGKSTLINAYLGQKIAIVTPRPQTTRASQLGIVTTAEYQIIFVDTPGMMKPRHKLDEFMLDTAVEAFENADAVLWMVDCGAPPGSGDIDIARQLSKLPDEIPVILAMNKVDLLSPDEVLERSQAYRSLLPEAPWILFSAEKGRGHDELLQMIVQVLPEGPRFYPADQITETFMRDIAAELIREQVLLQLRDEIPYGVAVQVDEFKERPDGTTYIHATLFVERDSHKRVVIGSKGSQLRRLGTAARREIAEVIDGKVYLDLWVKVLSKWRRQSHALKRLGFVREP